MPDYNERELTAGNLTWEHIAELARLFQEARGLSVDGKIGPLTRGLLELSASGRLPPKLSMPLPNLHDGRKPQITSEGKWSNPSRPKHNGVDLFYPYDPSVDPPVHVGNGGAAGDANGRPKWWIPAGTQAIAAARGIVVSVGRINTGGRVWLRHAGGLYTGYFHLANTKVELSDLVQEGHELGTVGDNPMASDATHLHFEVHLGDIITYPHGSQNPMTYLK